MHYYQTQGMTITEEQAFYRSDGEQEEMSA